MGLLQWHVTDVRGWIYNNVAGEIIVQTELSDHPHPYTSTSVNFYKTLARLRLNSFKRKARVAQ
jgi:hypothetical protein